MKRIYLIYGPTGSGKSKLADLLGKVGGAPIINADAMQVYSGIHILNASPNISSYRSQKYLLYNYISLSENYSVGRYIIDVENTLSQNTNYQIVGGTGMYISALLAGLSQIPDIPKEIREAAEKKLQLQGKEAFYKELLTLDPDIKNQIDPSNTQRLIRCYEVIKFSGGSLASYQKLKSHSILKEFAVIKIYLNPDRKFLYEMCDKRFLTMLKEGAVEEIQNLPISFDKLANSAKKIIGLQEIQDYLEGTISREEMIFRSQKRTRHYAKRQYTWFNNQLSHDHVLSYSSINELEVKAGQLIDELHRNYKK